MKITVTRSCGHSEDLALFGGKYDQQIERLRKQVCKACYRAKSRDAEERKIASLALPKLAGSEKQVAWATDIRRKTLGEIAGVFEARGQKLEDHLEDGGDMETLKVLMAETSAKWWIDHNGLSWLTIIKAKK